MMMIAFVKMKTVPIIFIHLELFLGLQMQQSNLGQIPSELMHANAAMPIAVQANIRV